MKKTETKSSKKDTKLKKIVKTVKGIVKKQTVENNEIIDTKELGVSSKSISRRTKNQEIKDRFDEYRLNGTVLHGVITGVIGTDHLFVQAEFDDYTVLIPDEKYFPEDYSFGSRYNAMNDAQKLKKRKIAARFRMDAKVSFIIEEISMVDEKNSNFILQGNRLKALEKTKERYLGNKSVKVGDEVKADVLAVFENFILVECLGLETRISAYNLTDKDVVDNCRDFVSVGEEITVRVKKMRYNPDGTYYLAVSGRLNHGAKNMRDITEGDAYIGYCEGYNSQTRIYTIKLKNGVNVSVHEKSVVSRGKLNRGDKVSAVVKEKKDGYCCGTCQKI